MPAPKKRETSKLPLRITVVEPPPGILWALQLGQSELLKPVSSSRSRITFDFTVDVVPDATTIGHHLAGPAVHGRRGERFVYLCIGAYAGQLDTPIGRRAKVRLEGISGKLITACRARRGGRLEARFAGTDSRGGAACATVPLLGDGWHIAT